MKRILTLFLCAVMLLCALPLTAFAEGDGNIDGGGGGMGDGTSSNYWNPGMDGVRVTVVKADTQQPVTTPIDLTNKKPTVSVHFGKVSKISYRSGTSLSPSTSNYNYYNPAIKMPTIISTDGNVNIAAIKAYFCDEIIIRYIAQCTGMNYDNLISGKYKLLLEPISYFTHNSVKYAFSAHEIALFDNQTSGALRKTMTSLTHKNQPLSMFLEYSDLGFTAYSGATNKTVSNDTIIAYLGLGIVRFADQQPDVTETDYSYEYRVNTDVITPVTLYAGSEINPDAPASVTFRINGSSYTVNNIVIPEDESQLVWVKWHTPSAPTNITITVRTTKGVLSQTSIAARVVKLAESEPPDPKATDTKGSWSAASIPNRRSQTSASWSVWSAAWHANWVWHENWQWQANMVWVSNWVWQSDVQWVSNMKYESYRVWESDWRYVSYQVWVPKIVWIPFVGNVDFGKYETRYKWVDYGGYVTRWHWVDRGSYQDLGKYVDKGKYVDQGKWVDKGKWVDEGWYDFTRNNYSASLSASSSLYPDDKVPTKNGWTMKSGYGVKNTATVTVNTSAPLSHYTYAQTALSYFPEFRYNTYWRI
ncbi:MAG: hypothetical protein PHV32_17090, partial [Eubacteriales bacterium]|nr:hypothetical protein [Eubacteriales bacterium]